MKKTIISFVMFLLLANIFVFADYLPQRMSYERYITDKSTTAPLSGSYTMNFSIYSQNSGGYRLWNESAISVTVTNGFFTHVLGSVDPINLPGNESYYFELTVNNEKFDRVNITQAMWAQRAQQANNLTESNDYRVRNLTVSSNLTVDEMWSKSYTMKLNDVLGIKQDPFNRVCVGNISNDNTVLDCTSKFEVVGMESESPFITITRDATTDNMGYAFGQSGHGASALDFWDFMIPGGSNDIVFRTYSPGFSGFDVLSLNYSSFWVKIPRLNSTNASFDNLDGNNLTSNRLTIGNFLYNGTTGLIGPATNFYAFETSAAANTGLQFDITRVRFSFDYLGNSLFNIPINSFMSSEYGYNSSIYYFSPSGTQQYVMRGDGTLDMLWLQGQSLNTDSGFSLASRDGDGDDGVAFSIFGLGNPDSLTDTEALLIAWDATDQEYELKTTEGGAGVARDINIYTSGHNTQIYLNASTGYVGIHDTIPNSTLDVNGSAHISENLLIGPPEGEYSYYNTPGDLYLGNGSLGVYNGQVGVWALPYGAPLIVNDNGARLNITSFGGTATLDATSQYICDSTDPFSAFNVHMFLEVTASTPSYAGATGEITNFINSTCIRVSFAAAGGDPIVDATAMSFIVYPHPTFAAFDNGVVDILVGRDPDANFHILSANATGPSTVYVEDTDGVSDHAAIAVLQDMNGFGGSQSLRTFMYSDKELNDSQFNNLVLGLKSDYINKSTYNAVLIDQIGNSRSDLTTNGIRFVGEWDRLVSLGSDDTLDVGILVNTSGQFNITKNLTSTSVNVRLFDTSDSSLYIGSYKNFTEISFSLNTLASQTILPTFWYCNNAGNWVSLSGVTDTTSGFTKSGLIKFVNPVNRGTCAKDLSGVAFGNTTALAYVAINRTRPSLTVPPVERIAAVSGATPQFIMQEDMLKLQPKSAPPVTCTATYKGAIYFDDDVNEMCYCSGAAWLAMKDATTGCS